jgi:hypothetical protein
MSKLSDIKQRARSLARRRDGDDLGPDRGTMDQEQARIERAKQEARREAKRERTKQRAQEARQQERKRVLEGKDEQGLVSSLTSTISTAAGAVSDGDNERVDDVRRAMSTDFDGDGQPLADELGLQSSARADAEDKKLGAIEDLANDNAGRIGAVEDDLDALSPQSGRDGGGRRGQRSGRQSSPDLDIDPGEFDPDFDDLGGGL